jgi:hypothetical protein
MRQIDLPPNRQICRAPRSRPDLAALAARARRNVPAQIEFPHPLSWWRVRPAHAFKDCDVFIARHFLRKSAILGEAHWFLGAAGDAPVAIGVANRIARRQRPNLVSLDLAMTAVLCVALEGDTAATLLLSAALKRRSDIDPLCGQLSDTWLTTASGRSASTDSKSSGPRPDVVRSRHREVVYGSVKPLEDWK